jgi:CheY-like chemotaxis protein
VTSAGPRILVVEDEFIVALELTRSLERMGYSVCGTVGSGIAAIDCVERERPDCILMDVSLKGEMDGIEAARHIQRRYGIRSVFLSGYPADEMMARVADVKPIGCFVKPLEYEQLEAALEDFFRSTALRVN